MSERTRMVTRTAVLTTLGVATILTAADAQSWRTVTSARQLQGEDRVAVDIRYGAGVMNIGRADGTRLYDFELRYNEDRFVPVTEYQRGAGSLRLGMESKDGGSTTLRRGETQESRATIRLTPEIPVALGLQFGAGEARIDLGGMSLESVDISTGASETVLTFDSPNRIRADRVRLKSGAASLRAAGLGNSGARRFEFEGGVGETVLDFSGNWRGDADASVRMGIGSLTLRFPRNLGVRLSRSSFLSSFNSSGLIRRGDEFYSANWEDADHRLTVQVNTALGSVDIEWLD